LILSLFLPQQATFVGDFAAFSIAHSEQSGIDEDSKKQNCINIIPKLERYPYIPKESMI